MILRGGNICEDFVLKLCPHIASAKLAFQSRIPQEMASAPERKKGIRTVREK